MVGVYFSGTGNSKYAVEKFVKCIDAEAAVIALENILAPSMVKEHDLIVIGYPVYFSDTPKIVKDFIIENAEHFKHKNVYVIATMAAASGDGAGCAARLLRKCGAKIIGGLHLKMLSNIADGKAFKGRQEKNQQIINSAAKKIEQAAKRLKDNNPHRNGLAFRHRMCGLFMQRLWFGWMTRTYRKKPKINDKVCTGCGACVEQCPMNNLKIEDGKAISLGGCTLCYRCINRCPQKAMTILGKRIYGQHNISDYMQGETKNPIPE